MIYKKLDYQELKNLVELIEKYKLIPPEKIYIYEGDYKTILKQYLIAIR